MLTGIKKYIPSLSLLFACFAIQCSQVPSTEKNTESILLQEDSSGLLEKKNAIPSGSISNTPKKQLPNWPLNAKKSSGKRFPFDQASKDTSFVVFREKLFQAVLEKDLIFLSSIIHNDIKFSFGAENGKADFLKIWKLNSVAENSDFWAEMEEILILGGGFLDFSKKGFYAPFIFILEDIDDPYTQAVIIGEKVRLRDQPSSQGKIIGSLGWDLVEIINDSEQPEETINSETHLWQKVKTVRGETGFVYGKYIRSPIDFRAGFKQYDGRWMMDMFIAGD